MIYQMIAFDMDGTLLQADHTIAPDSLTAIAEARQARPLSSRPVELCRNWRPTCQTCPASATAFWPAVAWSMIFMRERFWTK